MEVVEEPTGFSRYVLRDYRPLSPSAVAFQRFVLRAANFPRNIETLDALEAYVGGAPRHIKRAALDAWRRYARRFNVDASPRMPGRPRKAKAES